MSIKKVLQIRFRYEGTYDAFDEVLPAYVERMLTVPGLEWKIWAYDDASGEGAGLYLFADRASVDAYAPAMVAEMSTFMPEVSAHVYDFHESATALTRGPVDRALIG